MVMNTNQSIEVFPLQHISSSEDSSSSWQTVTNSMTSSQSSQVVSSNGTIPPGKKLPNSELSEIMLKELRRRHNGRSSMQQTELETAQHSMELLRQNIQHLFDNEVQVIIQKYIQTYFEPALKNIKENLENSGITDQYLKKMSCDLLEHAKQGYKTANVVALEPHSSNEVAIVPKTLENNSLEHVFLSYTNAPIKRKEPTVKLTRSLSSDQSPFHKRSPITFQTKTIANRINPIILSVTLTTDTLFTFDFKAHEAFDYAPNERLINKYPDLIHYIIDAQDKDWFIQQRILSPFHRSIQILLLTIEEVNRIAHSDILKNQPYPKPIELLGFKIPEFMLQKMRKSINDKRDIGKTIFANTIQPKVSLSALLSAAPKSTTIKSIQSVKPILKSQLPNTTTLSSVISSMRANSQPTTVLLVDTSGNGSKTATITSAYITSNDGTVNSPVISRSSLSSSHATLSALLSNSPTEKTLNSIVLNEITD